MHRVGRQYVPHHQVRLTALEYPFHDTESVPIGARAAWPVRQDSVFGIFRRRDRTNPKLGVQVSHACPFVCSRKYLYDPPDRDGE